MYICMHVCVYASMGVYLCICIRGDAYVSMYVSYVSIYVMGNSVEEKA